MEVVFQKGEIQTKHQFPSIAANPEIELLLKKLEKYPID